MQKSCKVISRRLQLPLRTLSSHGHILCAISATLNQPFWQALAQCPTTECTFEQRCQSSMWPLHQANLPQYLSFHKTAHQPDITHACSPDIIATRAALQLGKYGLMVTHCEARDNWQEASNKGSKRCAGSLVAHHSRQRRMHRR